MVLGSSSVAVTSPSDFAPASSKEFLDIQATIECGFTLKRVRDMTGTYRLNKSLEQSWHFIKTLYQEGKLQLYTSLKEHPRFENYLNLPNKKLCQAITKLRISAHKFPIETGRFDYRMRTERICPLCCDGIGDEMH